jgi:hypothetical protein
MDAFTASGKTRRMIMTLYYLENSVDVPHHKYYCNGGDCGGEHYDGTGDLLQARFFLTEEEAKSHIKNANDWWKKYDFHVEEISSEELFTMLANQKLQSFILSDFC